MLELNNMFIFVKKFLIVIKIFCDFILVGGRGVILRLFLVD